MNTEPNALDVARSLIPHMQGWTLDADTLRAIAETDTLTRCWASLINLDYPDARISVNTSHVKGKLHISGRYPRNWEPYIDGRGRVYTESINVSATKTPVQIARDISRRLLADTCYLSHVADGMRRKTESENGYDAGEHIARELATLAGTTTDEDRQRAYHIESRKPYDFNAEDSRRLTATAWPDTSGSRVEIKVSHGGKAVSLDLRDISVEMARRIVTLWTNEREKGTE